MTSTPEPKPEGNGEELEHLISNTEQKILRVLMQIRQYHTNQLFNDETEPISEELFLLAHQAIDTYAKDLNVYHRGSKTGD